MGDKEVKICPNCATEMKLEKAENFPDIFVCPECGYEELKK